jgi:hypothetical protein
MIQLYLLRILSQINITEDEIVIPMPDLTDPNQASDTVSTIMELAFGALGSIAFIVMVLAGLKFVLSRGNPDGIVKARNTMIYAAIGVILSILSFAIVRFVLRRFM